MTPRLDHFALVAKIYDRVIPSPDAPRLERLMKLPATGALLDAGGGTGRASIRFAPHVTRVVVSDLSYAMLGQARAKAGLSPLQAHAECLPFPDDTFARIMVVDALHHFCDQQAALDDLMRVLKPGGRMVIEEPDIERPAARLVALAEKMLLMGSRFYPADRVQAILRRHDASIRVERDGRFVYWVVADKH